MKTPYLLLWAFVALLANGAGAQSDMDERKLRFGMQAAPNLGWLKPNVQGLEKTGLQPRLGFSYGAMADWRFSESANYLFSTGFNITTCGGGLVEPWDSLVLEPTDTSYFTGKLNRAHKLQYITIPLLLKMRTDEIGYMSYFGAIGIDAGFRTRARSNDEFTWIGGSGPENQNDVNIASRVALLRLALNVSAGAEYNLSGNTNIYAALGWHNGFTNLFNNKFQNRLLEADENGNPSLDAAGKAIIGKQKKAAANYVSLSVGVFF